MDAIPHGCGRLTLTRRVGEALTLRDGSGTMLAEILVAACGHRARLVITAPTNITVSRRELCELGAKDGQALARTHKDTL